MNPQGVRSFGEVAHEDANIVPALTDHELFVINKTITLRIAALAEELAKQVELDRYRVSVNQSSLVDGIQELLEVQRALT